MDFIVTYDGVKIYIEVKSTNYEERVKRYIQYLAWDRYHEYEIMHGSKKVASIAKNGICRF